MANRRMFSNSVIDNDSFLELPLSAQALYFHAGLKADDDGFVSCLNRIIKAIGADKEDAKKLLSAGYLIEFPKNKVYVIRDFLINNEIKGDRYHATLFQEELKKLKKDSSKKYLLIEDGANMEPSCHQTVANMEPRWKQDGAKMETRWSQDGTKMEPGWNQDGAKMETRWSQDGTKMEPNCHQTVSNMEPEYSIDKDSIDKDSIVESGTTSTERKKRFVPPTADEVRMYAKSIGGKIDAERFCDYYSQRGWTVGKGEGHKMKDWKASVRMWIAQDKKQNEGGGYDAGFNAGRI